MVLFPDSPAPEREREREKGSARQRQGNIKDLLTCETKPQTHTHKHKVGIQTIHICLTYHLTVQCVYSCYISHIWIQTLSLTERFSIWKFIHCFGCALLPYCVLQKTVNEQTENFIHDWLYLGKLRVEARTVLHGHGWNNKLDYSTRYCDPNHKITFLDWMMTAVRLFPYKASSNISLQLQVF